MWFAHSNLISSKQFDRYIYKLHLNCRLQPTTWDILLTETNNIFFVQGICANLVTYIARILTLQPFFPDDKQHQTAIRLFPDQKQKISQENLYYYNKLLIIKYYNYL